MKKVLISKIGLDGHDVGARFITQLLKEQGFTVSYLGIRQNVEDIVNKARTLKPHAIGISIMTGGHLHFMPSLKKALDQAGIKKVKLICGGLIPDQDKDQLLKYVDAVFDNSSDIKDIIQYFKTCI